MKKPLSFILSAVLIWTSGIDRVCAEAFRPNPGAGRNFGNFSFSAGSSFTPSQLFTLLTVSPEQFPFFLKFVKLNPQVLDQPSWQPFKGVVESLKEISGLELEEIDSLQQDPEKLNQYAGKVFDGLKEEASGSEHPFSFWVSPAASSSVQSQSQGPDGNVQESGPAERPLVQGASRDSEASIPPPPSRSVSFDRPGAFSSGLFYYKTIAQSLWWYTVVRAQRQWAMYQKGVSSVEPSQRPVKDPKAFIAALRSFGTTGRFRPLGFDILEDPEVLEQARGIFKTYFDVDDPSKDSFNAFLERALFFNPGRRSSNFRKLVRDNLLEAAQKPKSQVAAFFDSLIQNDSKKSVEQFQKNGQGEVLAAFERIVRETILETRSVAGVILLGSYVNGAATASSDFDIQVITKDGRYDEVQSFLHLLEANWHKAGYSAEIAMHRYALPVSRRLLNQIHTESYHVITPYPEVFAELQKSDPNQKPKPPPQKAWWSPLVLKAYFYLVQSVIVLTDLRERAGQWVSEDSRGPPSPNRVWLGAMLTRVSGLLGYLSTLIAYPRMMQEATPLHFVSIMALGVIPSVATAKLNGALLNKMGPRNMMLLVGFVRIAVTYSVFVLVEQFGLMKMQAAQAFWILLGLHSLTQWASSGGYTVENTVVTSLEPKEEALKRRAILHMIFLGMQVVFSIFIGLGHYMYSWGIPTVFLRTSLVMTALIPVAWASFLPAQETLWSGAKKELMSLAVADQILLSRLRQLRDGIRGVVKKAKSALTGSFAGLKSRLPDLLFFGLRASALVLALGIYWKYGLPGSSLEHSHLPLVAKALLKSTLLIVGASLLWITGGVGFKIFMREKGIRTGLLISSAASFIYYPLQYIMAPAIGRALSHAPFHLGAEEVLTSQLLGAIFFGQLLASSTLVEHLPEWKTHVRNGKFSGIRLGPFSWSWTGNLFRLRIGSWRSRPFSSAWIGRLSARIGRFDWKDSLPVGKTALMGAVLLGLGWWLYGMIFPGSLPVLRAGMALSAAVMGLGLSLTNRGWSKFYGLGLAGVLPIYHYWGNFPIILISLAWIGFWFAANHIHLYRGVEREIRAFKEREAKSGRSEEAVNSEANHVWSVHGSFYNSGTAIGITFWGIAAALYSQSGKVSEALPNILTPLSFSFRMPATLTLGLHPISLAVAAVAILFWMAPSLWPGMQKNSSLILVWIGERLSKAAGPAADWMKRIWERLKERVKGPKSE